MTSPSDHHNPDSTRLTIPARLEYTQAVLDFAQTLTAGLGLPDRDQQHIRLALEETMEFLLRAALSGPEASAPVTFQFEVQSDASRVLVTEKGLPLDLNRLPEFAPDRELDTEQAEGLSLKLARHVMDRVAFHNRGRDGLEIELLKKVCIRTAALTPPADPTVAAQNIAPTFSIRPMQESDAVEIARCAYLTYGYTYEDYIYYPERIAEMNRTGELRSLVAVTSEGVVAGHCALKFSPLRPHGAELGVLFVKPAYRQHSLGGALWSATVELGRSLGLHSLFARSVTGHRASQTLAERHGFKDCALYLALFPRAVDLKSMGGLQPGKMSGMLQWVPLQPPRRRTIYPPDGHAEMITELYRRAGIPIERGAAVTPAGEPNLTLQQVDILNVAVLLVSAIGADVQAMGEQILSATRTLCRRKVDTLFLYIHLEEPGAALLAERCARMGFIFSGIAPDAFDQQDALVLQYLNLPEDPFEQLTVWTDTAALLRDYLRNEWQTLQPPMQET